MVVTVTFSWYGGESDIQLDGGESDIQLDGGEIDIQLE